MEVSQGFTQYTSDTVDEWRADHDLQPTTEIFLDNLKCSSPEVLNALFNDLGRTIDVEQGLKKFAINFYAGTNKLEEWPLGQLVLKSHNLETVFLRGLDTIDENRSQLLKFAG